MKYLLALLGLCLTLSVKADIHNVPLRDIKNIKYLFERLVDEHDFGYTIFGSKPMSLADFGLEVPSGLPIHRRMRSGFFLMKAKTSLRAWYKHKNEFDFKDFIFLDEEEDLFNCLVLVLINKKMLLNVLDENEAIFRQELDDSFTPASFLEKLEKRETSLAKAIHHNYRLLGIMLGYGVRNATLFQERSELLKEITKRQKAELPEDSTLTQKLYVLESHVGDFSELDADALIHPLYFLADVFHPETIALKKKYEDERQEIIELRKKRNFMDLVLERLVASGYQPEVQVNTIREK